MNVVARVALAVAFVAVLVSGCKRPCESSDNCKRTCKCVNAQTQAALDCTLAFRCETNTQTCEDDYDGLSCDEVCAQYAAHDECGFERCNADAECTKSLTCPLRDAQGNPTASTYDCTLTFACDQNQHLCAVESTQSPDQMCLICDQQRAAQGG